MLYSNIFHCTCTNLPLFWVVIFVGCVVKKSSHHLKYCLYGGEKPQMCLYGTCLIVNFFLHLYLVCFSKKSEFYFLFRKCRYFHMLIFFFFFFENCCSCLVGKEWKINLDNWVYFGVLFIINNVINFIQ